MKKFCVILAAIFILFTLNACFHADHSENSDMPTEFISDTSIAPEFETLTAATTDEIVENREETQKFIFKVNENTPSYECAATISHDGLFRKVEKITITAAESGELIQIIDLTGVHSLYHDYHEMFTNSAAYFKDINFDGSLDILIPYERKAHCISFDAYIWDEESKQFVNIPSFSNIGNPVIDAENKRIMAHDDYTQIQYYAMIKITGNNYNYIAIDSLVYNSACFEADSVIPDADNYIVLKETHGGVEINKFYIPADQFNEYNPQLKPYYEPGSFWDLNNPKWYDYFLDGIIDGMKY